MGFINKSYESNEELKSYIDLIWDILRGNEKGVVLKENLKVFVLALLGLSQYVISPQKEHKADIPHAIAKPQKIGAFDENGRYSITQKEESDIRKMFSALITNKIRKEKEHPPQVKEFDFAPTISDKSEHIANLQRKEIIEAIKKNQTVDKKVVIEDILDFEYDKHKKVDQIKCAESNDASTSQISRKNSKHKRTISIMGNDIKAIVNRGRQSPTLMMYKEEAQKNYANLIGQNGIK